jgi:hypothetical protein
MKHIVILFCLITLLFYSCGKHDKGINTSAFADFCKDNCSRNNKDALACKLTSPELQKRKATIIANLKNQIIERKELDNGYLFKFKGSDKMIDELTEFAKSERQCCDFFTFNISITGDTSFVLMELTGPEEVKEFIKTEMEL